MKGRTAVIGVTKAIPIPSEMESPGGVTTPTSGLMATEKHNDHNNKGIILAGQKIEYPRPHRTFSDSCSQCFEKIPIYYTSTS